MTSSECTCGDIPTVGRAKDKDPSAGEWHKTSQQWLQWRSKRTNVVDGSMDL